MAEVTEEMTTGREPTCDLVDLVQLSADQLEPLLDSEFRVDPGFLGICQDGTPASSDVYPADAVIPLTLVEVTRREPLTSRVRQDPFTLLFRGAGDQRLYGDVHVLEHPSLGRLAFYLNAVQAELGGPPPTASSEVFYECIIS